MKKILQLIVLVVMTIGAQSVSAQIKIGDNPGNIDPNAVLELESTTKGFLLPRMTTAQRLAITSPAEGMMVYDLTSNCTYIYRATGGAWYSLCSADSLTASNGLTKIGRDVQLGGTLTKSTTISTNGTNTVTVAGDGTNNPLTVTGLQGGVEADSIVTVNAATGVVRKRRVADLLQGSNIDSLVWKIDGNTLDKLRTFGTKNNYPVPIITNNTERMRITETGEVGIGTSTPTNKLTVEAAANPLKLIGLQTAAQTNSLLSIDAATGVVRKITIDSVASRGIVAENGLTKTGNIVRLGGTLNRATTIDQATNQMSFSNGNIAIGGSSTATSRLALAGSLAVPIVNSAVAFSLTDAHHTFIGNCATSGFTLDLPDPATCVGRTYIIIKGDATNNVLTFSRNIRLSTSQTMPSVNYNVRLHIQSDGTDWWLIARF